MSIVPLLAVTRTSLPAVTWFSRANVPVPTVMSLASAEAVRLAVSWGYRQVFYFREGYFAWQLQDFPQGKGLAGERLVFTQRDPSGASSAE